MIQNDSGMNIPPNSVVVVTFVEYTTGDANNDPEVIHHVTQYSGQSGNFLVTGDTDIPAGATGGTSGDAEETPRASLSRAYSDSFIYVAIDPGVAVPTAGEQWSPVSGKWYLSRGGSGFNAQGGAFGPSGNQIAIFNRIAAASQGQIFHGELTSTCSVATNSRSGSTTCTVQAYVGTGSTTLSGTDITVTNRSLTMNGLPGAYAFWTQIGSETVLLGVDCP